MGMLLAEDLLLLLLDDETGRIAAAQALQPALGGALLTELALAERVRVGEKAGFWTAAKVEVTGTPVGEPMLDHALEVVAQKPRPAQDVVNRLGKGAKEQLLERLCDRGVLQRREDRVLGIFPRTTWPAADSTHEAEVRRQLDGVLLQGLTPDGRTAALIALLSAVDQVHKVVRADGVPHRQVKARAKEIADGAWAAKAVKDSVAAAQAATMAAITVATTASATSATS